LIFLIITNPQSNLGIFFFMNFKLINAAIGISVVVAALIMASFITFSNGLPGLFGWKRWFLVGVLVCYSSFRLFRSYKMLKQPHEE